MILYQDLQIPEVYNSRSPEIYFKLSFLQQFQANHRQVWAHPKKIYWQDQYMPWGLTIQLW